jgi:hypothetical protein
MNHSPVLEVGFHLDDLRVDELEQRLEFTSMGNCPWECCTAEIPELGITVSDCPGFP